MMKLSGVAIFFYNGKVYLPSFIQFDSGMGMQVEPVYIVNIDPIEIENTIIKLLAIEVPIIPRSQLEEWVALPPAILKATKIKSWKMLDEKSISYSIEWSSNIVRLCMFRKNKKGRYEYDPENSPIFPAETSLIEIIKIMISDYQNRIA